MILCRLKCIIMMLALFMLLPKSGLSLDKKEADGLSSSKFYAAYGKAYRQMSRRLEENPNMSIEEKEKISKELFAEAKVAYEQDFKEMKARIIKINSGSREPAEKLAMKKDSESRVENRKVEAKDKDVPKKDIVKKDVSTGASENVISGGAESVSFSDKK